jgi:hypothetical protein
MSDLLLSVLLTPWKVFKDNRTYISPKDRKQSPDSCIKGTHELSVLFPTRQTICQQSLHFRFFLFLQDEHFFSLLSQTGPLLKKFTSVNLNLIFPFLNSERRQALLTISFFTGFRLRIVPLCPRLQTPISILTLDANSSVFYGFILKIKLQFWDSVHLNIKTNLFSTISSIERGDGSRWNIVITLGME